MAGNDSLLPACQADHNPLDSGSELVPVPGSSGSSLREEGSGDNSGEQGVLTKMITNLSSDLGHIDVSAALDVQKFDKMMEISDKDEDAMKQTLKGLVDNITKKIDACIASIPTTDPKTAEEHMKTVGLLMQLKREMLTDGVDEVMAVHNGKLSSWRAQRKKWTDCAKDTLQAALDIFKNKVTAMLDADDKAHAQFRKHEEEKLAMAVTKSKETAQHVKREADARSYKDEKESDSKRRKIELDATAAAKANEALRDRAAKMAEAEKLASEAAHDKALKEIDAQKAANEVALEKAQRESERETDKAEKELDRKERQGQIDDKLRKTLMEELGVHNTIYLKDLDLAEQAMRKAIDSGGKCEMTHQPPKIDWTADPPSVMSGHVKWHLIS